MVKDLSYLTEQPSEEQEEAIRNAVERECVRAIASYLNEVSDTMERNGIESLNVPSLRAMADSFTNRIENAQN
jgi:hypothetical protein